MKHLILTLLATISLNAAAVSVEEAVRKNDFSCEMFSAFKLKGFAGDRARFGLGLVLPKRDNAQKINCNEFLVEYYKAGSPLVFKFLDQIEALESPEYLAQLFSYETDFTDDDKGRILSKLQQLGLKLDSVDARLAIVLGNVAGRLGPEADTALKGNRALFHEEIKALTPLVPDLNSRVFSMAAGKQTRVFAIEAMKLEVLAQYHGDRELHDAAGMLSTALINVTSDDEMMSRYLGYPQHELGTQELLHMTGRSPKMQVFRGFDKNQYELAAILTIRDGPARIAALKHFIQRPGPGPGYSISGKECALIFGALSASQDAELTENIAKAFGTISCRTDDLVEGPVDFTGRLEKEAAFGGGKTLALQTWFEEVNKECKVPAKFDEIAIASGADFQLNLTAAIRAGCKETARSWARINAQRADFRSILQQIPADGDPATKMEVLRTVIADSQNSTVSASDMALAQERVGTAGLRLLKVNDRQTNTWARDMIVAAAGQDTDEAIILSWNGVKIEVDPDRINATQQKLIDAIRIANDASEFPYPVTEALISLQAESRQVSNQDRQTLDKSISEFLNLRSRQIPESLVSAKGVLDRKLQESGNLRNYNLSATSVFDVVLNGRMQCSSGTDFVLVHSGRLSGFYSGEYRTVAIMKPGHVLPGFVNLKTGAVEGVETTVAGKGSVKIAVKSRTLPENHQIILAEDYLLSKGLASALLNAETVKAALLARAESVLGLKQGRIMTDSAPSGAGPRRAGDGLNTSIFAFGSIEVPPGDQVRAAMDTVPADLNGGEIASLGRPRPQRGSSLARFPEVKGAEAKSPPGAIVVRDNTSSRILGLPTPHQDPMGHVMKGVERELRHLNLTGEVIQQTLNLLEREIKIQAFREPFLKSIAEADGVVVDVHLPHHAQSTVAAAQDSERQKAFRERRLPEAAYLWTRLMLPAPKASQLRVIRLIWRDSMVVQIAEFFFPEDDPISILSSRTPFSNSFGD
jgi:hypothetical protein